jgi:hypothetical protein
MATFHVKMEFIQLEKTLLSPVVVDFGCMCDRWHGGKILLVRSSNNTFQGTIQDYALSVLDELFWRLKLSEFFTVQGIESTDVVNLVVLLFYLVCLWGWIGASFVSMQISWGTNNRQGHFWHFKSVFYKP